MGHLVAKLFLNQLMEHSGIASHLNNLMDKRVVENKAHLVGPIIRHRIQDSLFYKEKLHLTNELSIVPIIVSQVQFIAGTDQTGRPSPFICCLLRLLELEPSPAIIRILLKQNGYNEFKYLSALALLFCRLVYDAREMYALYDEFIGDYRKLRIQLKTPRFVNGLPVHYDLIHMDEWVDSLVVEERVVDLTLPYIAPRSLHVERGEADVRVYGGESEEESYESDSD